MDKINLIVCENFSPDFVRFCEKIGLENVSVVAYPAMCMNKKCKADTAFILNELGEKEKESLVLCSQNCDIHTLLPRDSEVEVHAANYCFTHLASESFIEYIVAKGGYIIGTGWLKSWKARIAEAGFDRDTAIAFFHDFCKELVFFDTGAYPEAEEDLAELSRFLELPYVVIPYELESMRPLVNCVLSQRVLHAGKASALKEISETQMQCAEYSAIFDLMGKISAYSSKRETIDKVKEIFVMLFGAQQFKYWNHEWDEDPLPEEVKELLSNEEQDYLFQKEENRFCIKIKWNDIVFGAVEVRDFLFPEYIQKYLNFAIEIAKICGLVFSNSEQYAKIYQSEQDLRYSSTHDALTDLYNRTYLNQILDCQTPSLPFAVFMFDVDKLKQMNDTYGHEAGDQLIRHVAGILKRCFRDMDMLARIGGDEFVAILGDTDEEEAAIIQKRIEEQIEHFNQSSSRSPLPIRVSMGYAVGKKPEDTIEAMMKSADQWMYADKKRKADRTY